MRTDKKHQKIFHNIISKFINEAGHKITDNGGYTHYIDTKYGKLVVSMCNDSDSKVYSVFTRIENVLEAQKHINCNPFSGKWNFHKMTTENPQQCAESIIDKIKKIIT